MELSHSFSVPAPISEVWAAFNDLERIAPCFPGAALTSYDGDTFEGLVKIKLGPISLQYNGTGKFLERDEAAYRAIIEAKGKDKRGNGTAAATITASLTSSSDTTTDVTVATDLNITGKPAQFGRGVMQDVSDKLLAQFASCLETKLGTQDEAADEPEASVAGEGGASSSEAEAKHRAAESATAAGAPRRVSAPAEPAAAQLDLGATVLPVLLKRYAPYIVGTVVGLWILKKLLSRR